MPKPKTFCTQPNCNGPTKGRGLCSLHYARYRRYGDATKVVVAPAGSGWIADGYRRFTGAPAEHIAVAERALGRKLPLRAQVHHVNEDKLDNRPANLVICPSAAYHTLLHARMRASDACGNPSWRLCKFCKTYDDPARMRIGKASRSASHDACWNAYRRALRAQQAAPVAEMVTA